MNGDPNVSNNLTLTKFGLKSKYIFTDTFQGNSDQISERNQIWQSKE